MLSPGRGAEQTTCDAACCYWPEPDFSQTGLSPKAKQARHRHGVGRAHPVQPPSETSDIAGLRRIGTASPRSGDARWTNGSAADGPAGAERGGDASALAGHDAWPATGTDVRPPSYGPGRRPPYRSARRAFIGATAPERLTNRRSSLSPSGRGCLSGGDDDEQDQSGEDPGEQATPARQRGRRACLPWRPRAAGPGRRSIDHRITPLRPV